MAHSYCKKPASRWKSRRSDCLCHISLNCPPFASPRETDNRRKPPIESENASTLVLRWIQAANSTGTFRKPKTRRLLRKRSLSEWETMLFSLPWKSRLVWLELYLIRTQRKWNAQKHTDTRNTWARPLRPTAVRTDWNGHNVVQSLNISLAYLRAVCLNNVLWGVFVIGCCW